MKIKFLITLGLVILFFLGEIAMTFSSEQKKEDSFNKAETIPLSYKLSNELIENNELAVFDSAVNQFMEKFEIVGASLAIAKEGRLVYSKGFGQINDSLNHVVGPKNLFRIASVSKLITAVTIMKLVEDDKLEVDQKVFGKGGILNDPRYLNYKDKRIEDITIDHLLSHTAGWNGKKSDPIINSQYVARRMKIEAPVQMPDILEYVLDKKLDFTPGKKYSYSNLGFCILGEIIEKVTGMEYEDYVQFAILHPLGIYDMHIGNSFYNESLPNEVRYHSLDKNPRVLSYDGANKLVTMEYGGNNIELLGAAGGWVASAPELAKLMIAIDGFPSRPDIISQETINYMTRNKTFSRQLIGWRGGDGYGNWWRTGTLSGTIALIMRHPNETNWVILLNTTNEKRKRLHNELSRMMFRALYQVEEWPEHDLFYYEPGNAGQENLANR